jgi:leucyl/phenylalanyl-tRNA--protein transferase
MSNARLQEIALLPLDQRAARIAQLFAEEPNDWPAPRGPERPKPLRTLARGLAFWARPLRLPAALAALAAFAARKAFGASAAPRQPLNADGFIGVAPAPNAEAALDLYAEGLYFDAFPGLAALWSPPRRAIVRPAEALRLPRRALAETQAMTARFDRDFERLLDLCDARGAGLVRRPAFRAALSELFALGFAHALDLRDGEETRAGIVGVAIGGVFTVEGFFARDRAALSGAMAVLARHLAGLNFSAIDLRAPSPQLYGLPLELIGRDKFVALLAEPGGSRPGRWRETEAPRAEQQAA